MRARLSVFISIVQAILLLGHVALYLTWTFFWGAMSPTSLLQLKIVVAILSVSFVCASLLAFRFSNFLVRILYTLAATWLGYLNFFFMAVCAFWIVYPLAGLLGAGVERREIGIALFGIAFVAGTYGLINASWTRVKRISVKLPGLPQAWRGRTAALVSDWHLGHVRNREFIKRILKMLTRLKPDVLFITGDLYDGSEVDFERMAEPWANFVLPFGSYFVTGNHEQFSTPTKYLDVVERSGIRVLNNEKLIVEGLQIVGVHFQDSVKPDRLRGILQGVNLNRDVASVLLIHTPDQIPIAEEAGFSLQLCGHTHRGQFFRFTLIVSRIYRQFAYGLNPFGKLLVYTSCGAGTWGPPFRLGSDPEIVLIRFE